MRRMRDAAENESTSQAEQASGKPARKAEVAAAGGSPAQVRAKGADDRKAIRAQDLECVRRTLAGDNGAFAELFEHYRDRVYAVAYGYAREREAALDVVQDAFVKAYEKLSGFKGQSGFYTWVTQIAINLSIDRVRKKKRRKLIQLEEHHVPQKHLGAASPPDAPSRRLLSTELRTHYERALAELSEKHQSVFVLHTVKGMAYKEIALALEISLGTVMSRLHYARKRMRSLMEEYLS